MKLRSLLALPLLVLAVVGVHARPATGSTNDTSGKPSVRPMSVQEMLHPTETQGQAAQLTARFLTRLHYDPQPLDDAMSRKIWKAYLDALDSEKVFFTQNDLARFESLQTTLGDDIWNQELSDPFNVYNLYVQRAIERMNYARGLLKQGFDFSTDETYNYDRKKADWPKDQAELDTLWRQRTMNDWLRLKLAGKDNDEIRKTLDKRYASYIDRVKQLDGEDAFQTFMNAYAESTDPHTDYLGPRAAENFDITMKLSLEGIGAVLQGRDEYTVIREMVPGGPAAKSGHIKVGDRIVGIGEGANSKPEDVIGWRLDDVVKRIRGKKDTVVRLEILPADVGQDGKHELVTLVRQKVSIEESAAKKRIIEINDGGVSRKIGVIDLPSFYSDFDARREGDKNFKSATRDVAKLLGELKADGVEGIIMDLRNNGGGSLAEADSLTGLFINKGPVVQVRDARGKVSVQGDDDAGMTWSGPMVVLVNRGSASASEIFAAAIQDYGRGLIIGQPTFGKGTVQTLVDLDSFVGSNETDKPQFGELKMTIQEFFRINGGSTQLKGVTPDILFPSSGDEKDFGESTYDNALPWTQIDPANYKPVADLKAYVSQLQAKHDARVDTSPAWKLMLDELAQYRKTRDETTVSLNFDKREAERKNLDAIQADFRARHKAIDGDTTTTDADNNTLDDGLDASERSLNAELKQESDAKKAPDPQRDEAAHILFDAIGLIKADPKLAAQVLPYGGKFDTSPPAAPAASTTASPAGGARKTR